MFKSSERQMPKTGVHFLKQMNQNKIYVEPFMQVLKFDLPFKIQF